MQSEAQMRIDRLEMLRAAHAALRSYLACFIEGRYQQAWDRLRECGVEVSLRQLPNEENARALLWTAEQQIERAKLEGEIQFPVESEMRRIGASVVADLLRVIPVQQREAEAEKALRRERTLAEALAWIQDAQNAVAELQGR